MKRKSLQSKWHNPEFDLRIARSRERLDMPDYEPARVLTPEAANGWPGDYPGRLLLALCRLDRLSGSESERSRDLVAKIPSFLNEDGYFGPLIREPFDEQQLAGQGWLVSGLVAHYSNTGDEGSRSMAVRIIENLFLPLLSHLDSYPLERGSDEQGQPIGELRVAKGGWRVSSDTFCLYICLEGLLAAFSLTGDDRYAREVEKLAALLSRTDLPANQAQLHASLTAARSMHDFFELTGSEAALRIASQIYDQYASDGRSLNFGTWNWFGHSESWTEPCAIADSLILALALWRSTGETRYLDDAHKIEHSGLGFAQKPSGGFGLDSTATAENPWLFNMISEAPWCCTMRGPIALVEARERSVRAEMSPPGDVDLHIDMFHSGEATVKSDSYSVTVRMETSYPANGLLKLTIAEDTRAVGVDVFVHLPSWSQHSATFTRDGTLSSRTEPLDEGPICIPKLRTGEEIVIDLHVALRTEIVGYVQGREVWAAFDGPLLLGRTDDLPNASAEANVSDLIPLNQVILMSEGEAEAYRVRVGFDGIRAT